MASLPVLARGPASLIRTDNDYHGSPPQEITPLGAAIRLNAPH